MNHEARVAPGPDAVGASAAPFNFFGFVRTDHPFHTRIDSLRARAADELGAIVDRLRRGRQAIHAEIKAVPVPVTGWRLDRFYWCFQYEVDDPLVPFRAATLYYRDGDSDSCSYTFPYDPYLPRLGHYFDPRRGAFPMAGHRVTVLRYVPVRRITFLLAGDGAHPAIIGKMKRQSKLGGAYETLVRVCRAADKARTGFRIPAPLSFEGDGPLFFQEAAQGENLAGMVTPDNCEELFGRLGEIHGELNGLPSDELATWNFNAYLRGLQDHVEWVALFFPEHRPILDRVLRLLCDTAQYAGDDCSAFCHGDFVPSQVLVDGAQWTVTDFDEAFCGNPYRDMAKLVASLKHDVPLFQQEFESVPGQSGELIGRAVSAYLQGYQERTRTRVDKRRLLWFVLAMELYYLALTLKKDWYRPETFGRCFAHIRDLAHRLAEGGEI